jgi:hypothetical protein
MTVLVAGGYTIIGSESKGPAGVAGFGPPIVFSRELRANAQRSLPAFIPEVGYAYRYA